MPKNSAKPDTSKSSTPQPIAYSYIRFSTREQRKGDFLRRQTQATSEWCKRNNVLLDTSTYHDKGVGSYHGKNQEDPDRHALAKFLKMVEDGDKIPRGSYLVVENFDRLTRQEVWEALDLLNKLIKAGIRIVQLKPSEQVLEKGCDPMVLIMVIMELRRGHAESDLKSDRVGDAWKEKRDAARNGQPQPTRREGTVGGMKLLTHQLPLWLAEKGGKIVAIPERAKAVKRIFALAAAGHGVVTISKTLNEEGVKPFGSFEEYKVEEDGKEVIKRRAPKGERFGAGRWTKPYVARILRDRRALGEYQPVDHGKLDGEPIAGYYPAIVTDSEFSAARSPATPKKGEWKVKTRIGKHVDLFAGLLKDARGGSYVASTKHTRVLINATAHDGRSGARTFPLAVFERAMIDHLREIDPKEIAGTDDSPDEVLTLSAELAGIKTEIAERNDWMDQNEFSPTIAAQVVKLEAREKDRAAKLADARARASSPVAESWAEFRTLADALAKAKDPTDARVRLRAALRRAVSEIILLVVPRGKGRDRACYVQVVFTSGMVREYQLRYWSASNGREARWSGGSMLVLPGDHDCDLKNPKSVQRWIALAENMPDDVVGEMYHSAQPVE